MSRQTVDGVGFGRSDLKTFAIENGATGAAVDPVDFGRGYGFIVVRCEDLTGIASGTLSAQVGYDESDTMVDLYTDDMAEKWVSMTLPTTGGCAFVLRAALGAQRVRLILSAAADSSGVTFTLYGFDPTVGD